MGLLSIFQRNKQTSAQAPKGRGGKSAARQAPLANTQNPADTAEAMREVRARARTRLMGATVLLLIGVIGFPLLFETQPRPIPVDLPIEIPARNAPAVVDASSHAAARNTGSAAPLAASVPTPESVSYDARPSAPLAASASASTPSEHRSAFASLASALTSNGTGSASAPAAAAYVAPSMGGSSSTVAQTRPAAKPVKPATASTAGTVAAVSKLAPALHTAGPVLPPASKPSPAAILADSATNPPDAAANGGRFVVQVGAFLEDAKVREARAKVEKLGMKTYTQGVDTPTGKRIRVRVGPVATKAEADKIAARLKADGLQAVVLAL
jgi:DedD protein